MVTRRARCDEIRDLIEAYALGATDDVETAFVEQHLPDCPEAMLALADYLDITEAMLYLPATKPQPVATKPHVPRRVISGHTQTAQHSTPPVRVLPTSAAPKEQTSRSRIWWRLAGAAAVFVLLTLNGLLLWDNNNLRADVDALSAAVTSTTEAPPRILSGMTQHRVIELDTTDHGPIHGVFTWDTRTQLGTFYVDGLAVSATERLYQLWLIRDENSVLLGAVDVDEAEQGVLIFRADEPIQGFDTFLVTTEPEDDPSMRQPLFAGEL